MISGHILIDYNFQFLERALGHELLTVSNGPELDFYIAMAKLYILKGDYSEAENKLNEALKLDIEVMYQMYNHIVIEEIYY